MPGLHILGNDNQLLLLECEYTIDEEETGFVLKWYFNSEAIYQWIPPRVPFVFVSFLLSNEQNNLIRQNICFNLENC